MRSRALAMKYYAEKECVANRNLGTLLEEPGGSRTHQRVRRKGV